MTVNRKKSTAKKTWNLSFSNGALDRLERLPATERVEGEKGTFIPMVDVTRQEKARAEVRAVKEAIRAAMVSRSLARQEILHLSSGSGTYEEEGGNITIKFDPPGSEAS